MMTPAKDYQDVMWSTPIQSRYDSGYGTIDTFGCNLNLSPIRKNTFKKPNLAIVVGKNCTLKLKENTNIDNDVNKVTRKLPFFNNLKDAQSPKQIDSGIESMCKTADSQIHSTEISLHSKNQSLYRYLRSFPADLKSDFFYIFGNNISHKHSQPYKYICKENSIQLKSTNSDSSPLITNNDENNNKIESISLIKAKSLTVTDFLYELNIRNCTSIISIILSYLPNEDLRKTAHVSKTWQNIITNDKKANKRRADYVNNKKNLRKGPNKENKEEIKNSTERSHKSAFHNILNVSNESQQPLFNDNFGGRFDSFCQVANTLQNEDKLMKCPKCQYPSKILHENKFICTRSLCKHEFCKKCNGPYLDHHICSKPKLNPALPNIFIGSKKSKKNLRRL